MDIIKQNCTVWCDKLLYEGTLVIVDSTCYLTDVHKAANVKVLDHSGFPTLELLMPWDLKVRKMICLSENEVAVYIVSDVISIRNNFYDMLKDRFSFVLHLFGTSQGCSRKYTTEGLGAKA